MIPRNREVPPALPLTELVELVAPALGLDGTIQAPVGARVFAAAALGLAAVTLGGYLIPAARAARVPPVTALRAE
jgi:hypothetical protein